MYLGWYDDNPKKPVALKISEAIEAYTSRFKAHPNVVLVNEADQDAVDGVQVRTEGFIRRNNFWVGIEQFARAS